MSSRGYDPKHPTRPVPIARQVECLTLAATDHGFGFWSYLARYGDNAAFMTKGWPDAWAWFDLDIALTDAAETLALVGQLAEVKGDRAVRDLLLREIEAARPISAEPAA